MVGVVVYCVVVVMVVVLCIDVGNDGDVLLVLF